MNGTTGFEFHYFVDEMHKTVELSKGDVLIHQDGAVHFKKVVKPT
jgi:hypothetical protein